jgi:hypothetical protein
MAVPRSSVPSKTPAPPHLPTDAITPPVAPMPTGKRVDCKTFANFAVGEQNARSRPAAPTAAADTAAGHGWAKRERRRKAKVRSRLADALLGGRAKSADADRNFYAPAAAGDRLRFRRDSQAIERGVRAGGLRGAIAIRRSLPLDRRQVPPPRPLVVEQSAARLPYLLVRSAALRFIARLARCRHLDRPPIVHSDRRERATRAAPGN